MDLNQQLSLIQACSVCVCVGGGRGGAGGEVPAIHSRDRAPALS